MTGDHDLFGGTAVPPASPPSVTINTFADDARALTAEIVSAYVARNAIPYHELPAFIESVHTTVSGLGQEKTPATVPAAEVPDPAPAAFVPAVPVKKSVFPDRLISLIDGKSYKALKRHLSTHGLTPAAYRERYGLAADYPMVCADYSSQRADLARQAGLGRKAAA